MSGGPAWYRSHEAPPVVERSLRRTMRDLAFGWSGGLRVRGKTMVLVSRREFPALSRRGWRAPFHGLFSEFHSVLGALVYGEAHGAAGVRVAFDSPLYVDRGGANWWTSFFERDTMSFANRPSTGEIRLDSLVRRIGRFGGFSDVVQGETPYLYPMTYGVDRATLHRVVARHIAVRPEIRRAADRAIADLFDRDALRVGVHYRGTDTTFGWAGTLMHYRTAPVPYVAYADEVRRVVRAAGSPRHQIFVATDEHDFLTFMQHEFGDGVRALDEAPRVPAGGNAVHLDDSLPVSNDQKGRSALVDSLVLASSNYLVKGRSNLSDASLVFNPELPYSFCPDVDVPALEAREASAVDGHRLAAARVGAPRPDDVIE
jgi:hypothetical protein